MFKSALGVVISLCAFIVATPMAQAAGTSAVKKHAHKKQLRNKITVIHHARSASSSPISSNEKTVKKIVVLNSKGRASYQRVAYTPVAPAVPPVMSAGDLAGLKATRDPLSLRSNAVFVVDQTNSQILFEKNSGIALPIASLTKLMTAMIVVEARQNMDEVLEVTSDDIDREKNSSSRLRVGSRLSRANMLHIALMSSENRAASALGRSYPGGLSAFVSAMNAKAKSLGMTDTHYVDSTGLSSRNVASARDLAKLVVAAYQYPIIREYSTDGKYAVDTGGRHMVQYTTSNRLVMNPAWAIGLQKTGYITEAGHCLVMQATIERQPVVMVFLDSKGKDSRLADAGRIRKWLESTKPQTTIVQAVARQS